MQGQLGHAKFTTTYDVQSHKNVYIQKEPRKMLKSKRFKKLAVGDGFTLGVCSVTNSLYGWGEGPLIGRKEPTPDPILLPLPPTVKEIVGVYASSHHAAILDTDGHVYTWGQNCDPKGLVSSLKQGGQLGHGNRDYYEKPTLVESLVEKGVKAVSLALGNQHTLITSDKGKVYSCGAGEYGRLGTGNMFDCLTPNEIEAFALSDERIVQCAAGTNHSLALTDAGALYSWGRNETGQLGHFDTYVDVFSLEEYPKKIVSEAMEGLKVTQVAAAKGRSAAVTACGKLFLWGAKLNHYPALIDPSFFNNQKVPPPPFLESMRPSRLTRITIIANTQVVKVSCGGVIGMSVTSVITEDGALWTFGDSASRML